LTETGLHSNCPPPMPNRYKVTASCLVPLRNSKIGSRERHRPSWGKAATQWVSILSRPQAVKNSTNALRPKKTGAKPTLRSGARQVRELYR
jgi:hypothetical protein